MGIFIFILGTVSAWYLLIRIIPRFVIKHTIGEFLASVEWVDYPVREAMDISQDRSFTNAETLDVQEMRAYLMVIYIRMDNEMEGIIKCGTYEQRSQLEKIMSCVKRLDKICGQALTNSIILKECED